MKTADVIIVGSGVAALQLAQQLSRDKNVMIITKSTIDHGNSILAQGGIAAAISDQDHPFFHYIDTVEAGRSLNHTPSTLKLTQEAPEIIKELINGGCSFDYEKNGKLALGKEGAHHQNRIIHGGGDQTGKRVMACLKANLPPNVTILENHFVYELLMNQGICYGVKSKDADGNSHLFSACQTVLATGGYGQLYSYTSNASTVTGDGMAIAFLAGAEMTDMEFTQFHPTLLYINSEPKGLISEAVRGEGALLIDEQKLRIMDGVHTMKELAPRHIVAQTIYQHREQGHDVFLDIKKIDDFKKKFPSITQLCEKNGVDLNEGLIPVTPGCHFSMGGIKTDEIGRTTIDGLYAIGEVACSGVHGANRLASNSLLEGLVYGKHLACFLNRSSSVHSYLGKGDEKEPPMEMVWPTRQDIQSRMMEHAGIVRTKEGLLQHLEWLESFDLKGWSNRDLALLTTEQTSLMFMLQTSWLITKSALERKESRGGHFRADFPAESSVWQNKHIIQQRSYEMGRENEPVET